eukprot:maker-scaffold_12-snap-gene-12.7-mRNA-1 protein AED:0.24 eAED:0.24 QI:371/1/1/1/0.66/0.5/4/35/573
MSDTEIEKEDISQVTESSPVNEEKSSTSPKTEISRKSPDSDFESKVINFLLWVLIPLLLTLAYTIYKDPVSFNRLMSKFLKKGGSSPKSLYEQRVGYYEEVNSPEPGVSPDQKLSPTILPDTPVHFSVHFNGDGASEDYHVVSSEYNSLNDVIENFCLQLTKDKKEISEVQCNPLEGAKLFSHGGRRIYSFNGIVNSSRTYIVPQGVMFLYPLGEVGSVIYPETISDKKDVKLVQLSKDPRVFRVENFIHQDEIEKIIDFNREQVQRSEVGFAGWQDNTRTSYTSWDSTSWAAKKVQKRSFDLLSMPYDINAADSVQVLRYRHVEDVNGGEWYKPHVDWFNAKAYDGHNPTINNGTNRFATVFLYLTTLPEDGGGATVFPLSTTHAGYDLNETLVHKGTEKVAGYISDKDAKHVCSQSSSALKVRPIAGSAVLFYSQGPVGNLEAMSLHGGCPVTGDVVKWSANVWLWNRPKPKKSEAKDGTPKTATENAGAIKLSMINDLGESVGLFWDDGTEEMVLQMDLDVDDFTPMQTYKGHRFAVKRKHGEGKYGKVFAEYIARKEDNGETVSFKLLE